ncbi:MAG: hypothetical protein MHPSP_003283, partial [Paramarteilia canceri]
MRTQSYINSSGAWVLQAQITMDRNSWNGAEFENQPFTDPFRESRGQILGSWLDCSAHSLSQRSRLLSLKARRKTRSLAVHAK